MKCNRCKVEMIQGKALDQSYSGIPDFNGSDTICTMSPDGKCKMISCLKCPQCGHSLRIVK